MSRKLINWKIFFEQYGYFLLIMRAVGGKNYRKAHFALAFRISQLLKIDIVQCEMLTEPVIPKGLTNKI